MKSSFALVCAAALVGAACGSDDDTSVADTGSAPEATTGESTAATDGTNPTSTTTTTTAGGASTTDAVPDSTATSSTSTSTSSSTAASTSTAPTTDAPPPSTAPPPATTDASTTPTELALIDLDAATLAGWPNEQTDLVATASAVLGEPTADSGWLPMPPKLACTGSLDYRSFHWGDLRVVLERTDADAEPFVNGWSLGDAQPFFTPERLDDVALAPPSGVTTIDGIGVGDPIDAVVSDNLNETEPGRFVAPGARVVIVETDDAGVITGFESSRNDCIGLDISTIPCGRPIPVFTLPGGVPTGTPAIDGTEVSWSPAPDVDPAEAGDVAGVSEVIGGAAADQALLQAAATAPINARSGPVDVRLVPIGDPGVGEAAVYVFDDRTPCVRRLAIDPGPGLDEWRAYVTDLATQLAPQL